jgi:hypothetical protein
MTRRHPVTSAGAALALGALGAVSWTARPALARQNPEPPPAAAPAEPAPASPPVVAPDLTPAAAPVPAASGATPASSAPVGPATSLGTTTDHDSVVGRWGIEVRRVAALPRSARGRACGGAPCPVDLNSFGVRRWSSHRYSWNAGLAVAAGGGSVREGGTTRTYDTYFGIGPTLGASFLLANWQHLAVSAGPQLDFAFFLPSASGSKTILLNGRAQVEAELHLGFMGLPAASVGVLTGLGANLTLHTEGDMPVEGQPAADWSISTLGPTSLWDVVTNAFVRFYF